MNKQKIINKLGIISTLFVLSILILSPIAFAEQLQIKKVSDLKEGDVIEFHLK